MSATRDVGKRCPSCGEPSPVDRRTCWLCGAGLDEVPVAELGAVAGRSISAPILLMAAIAVVAIGAALVHLGLGITGAILLAIPALRTIVVAKARSERGRPLSTPESVGLFAVSLVVTWVIITVVGVAAVGTFCFTCIGAHQAQLSENTQLVLAGGATLFVVGGFSFLFFKWVVARYRRDTQAR